MRKLKKITAMLISALMIFALSSCNDETVDDSADDIAQENSSSEEASDKNNIMSKSYSADDTWAIYWYLCGSDLESGGGAATEDLAELTDSYLPDNVTVVIQTGGANEWQNDVISADSLGRYIYNGNELELVDEQPSASMGSAETLADFLSFASTEYPADHTAVFIWNHGGGSVSGAAFDELYDYDSLSLDEMKSAFSSVYETSYENPPLELVGFDCCLMATVDTANIFSDISRYFVASEEVEPGNGWYYTDIINAFDGKALTGADLGIAICDSYAAGCEMYGTADEITLSVIDLQKLQPLLDAYNNIGTEALNYACEDPLFFSEFGRKASVSENYGGNNNEEGYTNMVDMGSLIRNSQDILPENADEVLQCLDDCVVYKVNGAYRQEASGLSCYYSYNYDYDDYMGYTGINSSEAFEYLYGYLLNGDLPDDGGVLVEDYDSIEIQDIPSASSSDLNDYPLTITDEGYAQLDIGADTASLLTEINFELYYIDEENDFMMLLGRDNDIYADWENGVFEDNFRNVWGSIDGCFVYMDYCYSNDDYNIYSVPVLLNGEEVNLSVVYNYETAKYSILGARKELSDNGMADKNLIKLMPGDEITTIHYSASISGDDDFEPVYVDTFNVTETTEFTELDMGDGDFVMMFEMVDVQNNYYYSAPVWFTVENGEIYAEV